MKYKCTNPKCNLYNSLINISRVYSMFVDGEIVSSAICKECGLELKYVDENHQFPKNGIFKGSSNGVLKGGIG